MEIVEFKNSNHQNKTVNVQRGLILRIIEISLNKLLIH